MVSDSIFNKFAKLILFVFDLFNQIFSIFNHKARFLNFFIENIVFEALILLFHLNQGALIFLDDFFILWKLSENCLLFIKVSLSSISLNSEDIFIHNRLIACKKFSFEFIIVSIICSNLIQNLI